jgi:hypothetical protein
MSAAMWQIDADLTADADTRDRPVGHATSTTLMLLAERR